MTKPLQTLAVIAASSLIIGGTYLAVSRRETSAAPRVTTVEVKDDQGVKIVQPSTKSVNDTAEYEGLRKANVELGNNQSALEARIKLLELKVQALEKGTVWEEPVEEPVVEEVVEP